MENQKIINKTKNFVRKRLLEDASGHDWWHSYRVWKIGKKLATEEKANVFLVELMCLLHDIADYKLNNGDEMIGLKLAYDWLSKIGVEDSLIKLVTEGIQKISFKGVDFENKSLSIEEKCVQDADGLDALGAIGIARCFAFGGFNGNKIHNPKVSPRDKITKEEYKKLNVTSINHFYEKLLHLKELMNTETAKNIAEKRHNFMKIYLEEFFKEWNFNS